MRSDCIGELRFSSQCCYIGTNTLNRVEANGKHYQAGGYPFVPLSFHSVENAE
jgi:hypothetical protein